MKSLNDISQRLASRISRRKLGRDGYRYVCQGAEVYKLLYDETIDNNVSELDETIDNNVSELIAQAEQALVTRIVKANERFASSKDMLVVPLRTDCTHDAFVGRGELYIYCTIMFVLTDKFSEGAPPIDVRNLYRERVAPPKTKAKFLKIGNGKGIVRYDKAI